MEKNIFKGKRLGLIFIIVLIAAGVIYFKSIPVESNQSPTIADANLQNDLGIPVTIIDVSQKNLIEELTYIGTINSKETVEISSKIPGEITELNIREGDVVKKGQIIAKLDSESMEAKINTTNINIEKIELNLEYLSEEESKQKILYNEGAISEATYKKIKHEMDMAKIQLKELHSLKNELMINLEDTIIRSPLSGIVRNVNYSLGELAVTGKPLAIIDDTSQLSVKINIPESDLGRIENTTLAILEISGINEKIRTSENRIKPNINPKTRIGEIKLDNLDIEDTSKVLLGSSVSVDFIVQEIENSIVIPGNSVKELSNKKVVYIVKDNTVEEREVETGLKVENNIEILKGLNPGDKIAVDNINKLYHKARIYVFEGDVIK